VDNQLMFLSIAEFSIQFVQDILCARQCPNITEGLVNRLLTPAKETELCSTVWWQKRSPYS